MTSTRFTQMLLTIIAVALTAIALRPYVQPAAVQAQTGNSDPLYVEPGVYMLRIPQGGQVLGKVAVNLRTGNVWGFPTGGSDPYPVSPIDSKAQVSHPVPLGRFAFGEAARF